MAGEFSVFRLAFVCFAVCRLHAGADNLNPPPSASSRESPATLDSFSTEAGRTSDSDGGTRAPASFLLPPVIPSPGGTLRPNGAPETEGPSIDWRALFRASERFLAIEHGFRLLTEPGTREGLKGSFLRNYMRAASNLHGWADGDEFYVNYVGHPMQGSVAGFLWVQNDRDYRRAEFGKSSLYWKGRLRAAAYAWAYSTQFEIGPVSEASLGAIQAVFPQQGFVDHVITPSIGLGWMVAEDVMDKYLIKRIEAGAQNRWIRLLARGGLNPCRTFANVLQGNAPWRRETRAGILRYRPEPRTRMDLTSSGKKPARAMPDPGPSAPFEFTMTFQPERIWGGGKSLICVGGGGNAALRLKPAWQLVIDVAGCNMLGLETNVSGDSLTYMAGPRWVAGGSASWTAHWQFLIGGNKLTEERMWPEKKKVLEAAALLNKAEPPSHMDYTDQAETSGFAISTGGGVDYKLNRALALRLAEVSYRRSWAGPLWGRTYSNGLKFVSGLVVRMGTW